MTTVLKIATKKIWGLWVAIFFTTRFDGNKRIFFLAWPIFQEIFSNAFYSYSKNRTTSLLTWQKKLNIIKKSTRIMPCPSAQLRVLSQQITHFMPLPS